MKEPEKLMNRKQENWATEAAARLIYPAIAILLVLGIAECGNAIGFANQALHFAFNQLSKVGDLASDAIEGYKNAPSLDLFSAWLGGKNPGIEIADSLSRTNHDVIGGTQRVILSLKQLGK